MTLQKMAVRFEMGGNDNGETKTSFNWEWYGRCPSDRGNNKSWWER